MPKVMLCFMELYITAVPNFPLAKPPKCTTPSLHPPQHTQHVSYRPRFDRRPAKRRMGTFQTVSVVNSGPTTGTLENNQGLVIE